MHGLTDGHMWVGGYIAASVIDSSMSGNHLKLDIFWNPFSVFAKPVAYHTVFFGSGISHCTVNVPRPEAQVQDFEVLRCAG